MSETNNLKQIQLDLPKNVKLFRNNVGLAVYEKNGRKWSVKYGLCEGSSDLVGFTKITITPEMVGREISVFTACEVKAEKGAKRTEQIKFIDFIKNNGGISCFAKSIKDLTNAIDNFINNR